jgi:hypothetical protein
MSKNISGGCIDIWREEPLDIILKTYYLGMLNISIRLQFHIQ